MGYYLSHHGVHRLFVDQLFTARTGWRPINDALLRVRVTYVLEDNAYASVSTHSQSQRLPAHGTKRLISKLWPDLTFHCETSWRCAALHRHCRSIESPVAECEHQAAWTAVQVGR